MTARKFIHEITFWIQCLAAAGFTLSVIGSTAGWWQ